MADVKKDVKTATAAFIGLGTMGYPMAGHLSKAGCDMTVYNRTTSKAEKWVAEFGGKYELTPREAAKDCDIVFVCVGNDDDLRSVLLGEDGAFAGMKPGAVLWDDTTDSASVAREMYAKAKSMGLNFVDAPVSGGQAGAENGILTVMCGGDEDIIKKYAPVADAFAISVTRIGPSGSGQLAKMCNQICIAGVCQGLAEAIAFGKVADLDMPLVLDVISKGAAASWQMKNRGLTMDLGQFNFGFAVDWMRKDLNICLSEARKNGAELPLTALVDQFYAQIQNMGGGRWDTSSLIARLNQKPKK
ncbi:MAG: NAD(P)-dependent oxidoreductase [Burkholderiales bacterium]|nr:NAD(P)-dependent oxidoreductase [Burkholderiales bacterium]